MYIKWSGKVTPRLPGKATLAEGTIRPTVLLAVVVAHHLVMQRILSRVLVIVRPTWSQFQKELIWDWAAEIPSPWFH